MGKQKNTKRPPNKLINETSPYLLQHAYNPVHWYPWGKDALQLAQALQKPIFLSIGYSACHWCHVMERESFEDDSTAKLMNESFVNLKVDREERQDLDQIYMSAVQMMTQHGGWPLSVFLTPDLKPFYGGTYFPPEDRHGLPSFKKILTGVAAAWKERRTSVLENAEALASALKNIGNTPSGGKPATLQLLKNAVQSIQLNFDSNHGGIGHAPKFFHVMDFKVALRYWKTHPDPETLQMVTQTLHAWACGGIRDSLGGGFHRYSTDPQWLVPHFEKMLYDNALVTDLFLEGYQATQEQTFASVVHHTLDFILSEMQREEGGFFSTFDADSEGIEGKYYVWTLDEIRSALPADVSAVFEQFYGVTTYGNWEGHNILEQTHSWETLTKEFSLSKELLEDTLSFAKRKLLTLRRTRVAPFRDEKLLTNWNGLMIETLAKAFQVLGDARYYEAAKKAAHFFLTEVLDEKTNILYHSYKEGIRKHEGFLDDYSNLTLGLLSLYESDFDPKWIHQAKRLVDEMIETFFETGEGIFYLTSKTAQDLIVRPIESQDGATPSAAAMATTALVRLYHLTDEKKYLAIAETLLTNYQHSMEKIPSGAGQFLIALDLLQNQPLHFVIAKGSNEKEYELLLETIRRKFLPQKTVLQTDPTFINPHFEDRKALHGRTTLYLCKGHTCLAPIQSVQELEAALENLKKT